MPGPGTTTTWKAFGYIADAHRLLLQALGIPRMRVGFLLRVRHPKTTRCLFDHEYGSPVALAHIGKPVVERMGRGLVGTSVALLGLDACRRTGRYPCIALWDHVAVMKRTKCIYEFWGKHASVWGLYPTSGMLYRTHEIGYLISLVRWNAILRHRYSLINTFMSSWSVPDTGYTLFHPLRSGFASSWRNPIG